MIKVDKISDELYRVSATPALSRGGESWSPTEPLSAQQMVKELFDRGFNQQDIGDAIYEADQNWMKRSRKSN